MKYDTCMYDVDSIVSVWRMHFHQYARMTLQQRCCVYECVVHGYLVQVCQIDTPPT